jgi:hypothetical protein
MKIKESQHFFMKILGKFNVRKFHKFSLDKLLGACYNENSALRIRAGRAKKSREKWVIF